MASFAFADPLADRPHRLRQRAVCGDAGDLQAPEAFADAILEVGGAN